MKFYNREQELNTLNDIYKQCRDSYGKITVLTGRRRIGKTLLAKKYAEDKDHLYLFTSKKAEKLICDEFLIEYEDFINEKHIGKIDRFSELFELLLIVGTKKEYVLIIDEFQEFKNINKSTFSEIQKLWDKYKFKTHVHIIFIGSIYSLMTEIFQNEKEPLYGRADRIFYIKPFKPNTIKEILEDYDSYTEENLFYNFLITGGVPRYQELLYENGNFTKENIINQIFQRDSFFIEEGRSLLIQEFGKEYGIYFSILELISSGKTSRSEIEAILEKSVGGYLERLENEYDVVVKVKPIGVKKDSRNQKYTIKDNFIRFWFRFIYKNMTIIQNERFEYIKQLIERDISTYAGPILEKLFIEIMNNSPKYGLIGTYWERGNLNEIDIVAIDDLLQEIYFAEVKLNKDKIKMNKLKEKTEKIHKKYTGYNAIYEGLSITDIDRKIKENNITKP
ncbi:MAG: ATP-binding protein [Spirochaetaceae bacterium]|nr:ATP-binding protein [Spirochaetaceae bacterium]